MDELSWICVRRTKLSRLAASPELEVKTGEGEKRIDARRCATSRRISKPRSATRLAISTSTPPSQELLAVAPSTLQHVGVHKQVYSVPVDNDEVSSPRASRVSNESGKDEGPDDFSCCLAKSQRHTARTWADLQSARQHWHRHARECTASLRSRMSQGMPSELSPLREVQLTNARPRDRVKDIPCRWTTLSSAMDSTLCYRSRRC